MEKASLYSKLVAKVSVKHIVHPGILIIQPPFPPALETGVTIDPAQIRAGGAVWV